MPRVVESLNPGRPSINCTASCLPRLLFGLITAAQNVGNMHRFEDVVCHVAASDDKLVNYGIICGTPQSVSFIKTEVSGPFVPPRSGH